MELIGIEALKRLPYHSSTAIGEIEKQLTVLVELVSNMAASIRRVANLQELVSAARVKAAKDEIAVIRQVTGALNTLRHHFSLTMADGSVELAQHRVEELLTKADEDLDLIVALVERERALGSGPAT